MMMVLSGTQDGRELISLLIKEKYPLIVTTATGYGGSLIENTDHCQVIPQKLSRAEMEDFMVENGVELLIDATHPFAVEVSQNAMDACENRKIPYFRYQRSQSDLEPYQDILINVFSYKEAIQYLKDVQGNILLSTGSKVLQDFAEELDRDRLFPRVLPTSDILKKCEDLGFKPSNIIAMQGPFSLEMNIEMIRKYKINLLVSKESGDVGGTIEKLQAAQQMNIPVILINRPKLDYKNCYEEMDKLMDKVRETYGEILSNHDRYKQ